MKLYGEIDLHSNNRVVVLVDEDSREMLRKRIDNDVANAPQLLDYGQLRKNQMENYR